MLIFYGTKTTRKYIGRVADFCPVCRDVSAIGLTRIGLAASVDLIAIGDGEAMAFEAECEACHYTFKTHERRYAGICEDSSRGIDELRDQFGPTLLKSMQEGVDLGTRIRAGNLDDRERSKLMRESFVLVNELAIRRKTNGRIDQTAGSGCWTTLLFLAIAFVVVGSANSFGAAGPAVRTAAGLSMPAIILCGIAYCLWLIKTDPGRYVQQRLLFMIARSLKPFQPSQEELEGLITHFRGKNYTLAKNITADQLFSAIQKETQPVQSAASQ